MMDIYGFMNKYLMENNYYDLNISLKKELIESGLKKYTIDKINEQSGRIVFDVNTDVSFEELFNMLGNLISKENHFYTIRHYTHLILNIAGNLQNYSITWISDVNNPVTEPIIKFNEFGLWNELETDPNPDQVQTFNFVYDTFKNNFMVKQKDSAYILKQSNNN